MPLKRTFSDGRSDVHPWRRFIGSGARVTLCAVFACLLSTAIFRPGFGADHAAASAKGIPVESAGGELQVYWNRPLLQTIGVRIQSVQGRLGTTQTGFDRFGLRADSSLRVAAFGRGLRGLRSGTLYVNGGYVLSTGRTTIDLTDFVLTSKSTTPQTFEIATAAEGTLFYADRLMAEPSTSGRGIVIRTMDMRISSRLAARLHKPEISGWQVATLRTFSRIVGAPAALVAQQCPSSTKWDGMPVPGHPGSKYRTDVFMRWFGVQLTGCKNCTGPGGQGQIKITPTTLLQNNVNNGAAESTVADDPNGISHALYSADVPWRQMFSKDCPPYGNDQHPYLAWNLYRIDAKGRLDQLSRSGVKHGHIAENGNCVENPGSNHVLGRGCTDAYGTGDNDAPDMLGPRSEIVPAKGLWGRCGSIYDPTCKGYIGKFRGYDDFTYRLLVSESTLDPGEHPDDHFYVEAWYVVRNDIDPYNSMATVPIKARWYATNHLWTVTSDGKSRVGPMIDRWVSPVHPGPMEANRQIVTEYGRIKIAVKAKKLATNRYRYDFVVMNVDFADARISGREPNIRIVSARGLNEFDVEIPRGVRIQSESFEGLQSEDTPAWTHKISRDRVLWRGSSKSQLTWGTLYRFSFESDQLLPALRVNVSASDIHRESYHTTMRLGST